MQANEVELMPISPQTFRKTKQQARFRGTTTERGYGSDWQKLSKRYRAEHPVCEVCRNEAAAHVDHIIPFIGPDDPLRMDVDNLRSICIRCHAQKTNRQ